MRFEKLLKPFESWLKQHGYSTATIRNYLLDVSKYLDFVSKMLIIDFTSTEPQYSVIFGTELFSSYIEQLTGNNNTQRYLASLNSFCQFAVDQHLISSNPIAKIRKNSRKPVTRDLVYELRLHKHNFETQLVKGKYPQTTIRNYINDVEQYINWLEAQKLGTK